MSTRSYRGHSAGARRRTGLSVLRGINLNGAEFGCDNVSSGSGGSFSNTNLGTVDVQYHYPTSSDFSYLAGRGVKLARLPIRWERFQPTLGAALDTTQVGYLTTALDNAAAAGIKLVPEPASWGAYWSNDGGGVGVRHTIDTAGGPTHAQFADFWSRIATAVAGHTSGLGAYGLSNEPLCDAVAGSYTASKTWATFDSTTESWQDSSGTSSPLTRQTTTTHAGAGALQAVCTRPASGFSGTLISTADFGVVDWSGSGTTLHAWVYLTAGQPGTTQQARIAVQWGTGFTWDTGPSTNLTAGAWTLVSYAPTTTTLQQARKIGVSLDTSSSAGGTVTYYIDDYTQGSLSGSTTGAAIWQTASQAAATAIAAVDSTTPIAVPLYGFNITTDPNSNHTGPWISGVSNPIWYEAHQYCFSTDETDTYATCLSLATSMGYTAGANPDALHTKMLFEIDRFHTWLAGAQGYVGELGLNKAESVSSWTTLGQAVFAKYNTYNWHVTCWAAGSWWVTSENFLIYGASTNVTLDTAYAPLSTVLGTAGNLSH